ncbi:hypothetical protein GCM10012286_64720 [Streptomyces lasiicapitis]|uniref:CSD domain-containing protein n=1 Tax=Streptomyces lasiicapitis TaxID=1923961 RepID=A0ABQ2MMM7_9ACTN|nr:hypothetical protein GCM10012286_64720 [Streptomyces lasiicapitis]
MYTFRSARSNEGVSMPCGVVKWFDPVRGVGAIALDDGGADAVAHRSAVHGVAEPLLVEGDRVRCDVTQDGWAVRADNIRPVTPEGCPPTESPGRGTAAHQEAGRLVELQGSIRLPCRGPGSVRRALGAVIEWLLRAPAWSSALLGRAPRRVGGNASAAPGTPVAGARRSRSPDVEAFGTGQSPALDVVRADAGGTTPRVDDVGDCPWCAQLQEADAAGRQVPETVVGAPAPWMVPPGLPPRRTESDL